MQLVYTTTAENTPWAINHWLKLSTLHFASNILYKIIYFHVLNIVFHHRFMVNKWFSYRSELFLSHFEMQRKIGDKMCSQINTFAIDLTKTVQAL